MPRSSPSPCLAGHAFALKACIDSLQKELVKVEAMAAAHRADFEREREAERRMAELLKAMADAMAARESAARLEGELLAMRSRSWWRRLAG
jgi:phage-related minor tail protein